MDTNSVVGKSLVLVLWAKDEYGEDDVAVFPSMLMAKNGSHYLARESGTSPEIRDDVNSLCANPTAEATTAGPVLSANDT